RMTGGIGYALGALLLFGLGDLIYKRAAAAGARPHHLLMVQSWVFLPSVAVYGLLTGALHFGAGVAWGAGAGLFMTIGFYNFAHSLESGSISINAPIFRLSFVITAGLAVVVLGESLTSRKGLGIALALAATWLLLGGPAPENRSGRRESGSSLVRVLVATAAVGIGNVAYKFGLRDGITPASLIVAQAAVVVTLSTLFAGSVDRGIRPAAPAVRYAPLAGIVLATAFVLMVESLAHGEASVVIPIAQMGFLVTAMVGFVLLREPFTLRKGLGLAAALGALAALASVPPGH
ncbi:MAG: EamA family transporter, partial [Stellaceae bacterium]